MEGLTDEEIIEALRRLRPLHDAPSLARELARLRGEHSQFALISYFKRAFPDIPLRTLIDAGGWHELGGGPLTDTDFARLLAPWLPRNG